MKENQLWAQRHNLIEQLPLDTPLGIHLCASSFCNFRCEYCVHVNDGKNGENPFMKSFSYAMMDMDTIKRIIDQLRCFPRKVKCVNFAWYGEPLTNPDITSMVSLLKESEVADCVSIVTNASLLDENMTDSLINAGLDRLRISLQGLDSDTYEHVGGVRVDFDKIVDNIRYFYRNKKKTDVYVKIVDSLVREKGQEERFHQIFDEISDYVNVECIEPLVNELDISDMNESFDRNYYGGTDVTSQKICSYCFYQIIISPQGDIYPCCSIDYEEKDGIIRDIRLSDIWSETLFDYWNGERLKEFRMKQIEGNRFEDPICAKCTYPRYHISNEDRLDGHEDRLRSIYER